MLPAMDLSADEKIIFQGHPSWRAILGFYLKGVVIAIILGIIAIVRLARFPHAFARSAL